MLTCVVGIVFDASDFIVLVFLLLLGLFSLLLLRLLASSSLFLGVFAFGILLGILLLSQSSPNRRQGVFSCFLPC